MEKEIRLECGNCKYRLLFHHKYEDVKPDSKYSRCSFRPELKQKNNSSPKWCPCIIKAKPSPILIDCYEEDGREVQIYEYKGTEIYYNLFYEYEYTINDYWFSSLEKAIEAIDNKMD